MANSYECPGINKKQWVRWFNRFKKNPDICPKCHNEAQKWYQKNSGIIPSLEPHHYVGNFELHDNAWAKLGLPRPIILQGDSRQLCEILEEKADCIVSSPPFQEAQTGGGIAQNGYHNEEMRKGVFDLVGKRSYMPDNQGKTNGNLSAMKPGSADAVISSPPYQSKTLHAGGIDQKAFKEPLRAGNNNQATTMKEYGITPGQLGAMKTGDVDCVISSPPYAESLKGDGTQSETASESRAKRRTQGGSLGQSQRTQGYGSRQNLGNLKAGDAATIINRQSSIVNQADCIVSSPPFQNSMVESGDPNYAHKFHGSQKDYGNSEGQLGQEKGETFWSAAKIIVEQCHKILKDGGVAIFVVKDFVRNKKRVDFCGDWRRLCESVGFETLHEHHAMLVKEETKETLFGDTITKRKERKSFYRRLAESKGSPPIDYEVVLCMRKPSPSGRLLGKNEG
jgi:hypothetical protein